MVKRFEIFKCRCCGSVVEVLHPGIGDLVCCEQHMQVVDENNMDASRDKHEPVYEKMDDGIMIKIGNEDHPMMASHHVQWIELVSEGESYRHFLKPGDKPEVFVKTDLKDFMAREYCNLHGLWKK